MPKYMKAETAAMIMIQGSPRLSDLYVTENGEYNPVPDEEDGFKKVTVAVPTYEQEYEDALEQIDQLQAELDTMTDGFEEKQQHLLELTGIKAKDFAELDQLIDLAVDTGKVEEEPETPSQEDQGKTDPDDPTPQEDIDPIAEGINDDNGEPSVTDTPQDGGGDPDCIRSYFAIKGLGWYSLRIDKNNKFEPTCMWWGYAMCFNTTIRVIVTKFDEHGNENIVYSNTLDTHSHGNYNWPYDPDYVGDQGTPPGTTKGWKGNDDSPKIQFYRSGNALHIAVYRWSISGGGGMSGQWYETTITLT